MSFGGSSQTQIGPVFPVALVIGGKSPHRTGAIDEVINPDFENNSKLSLRAGAPGIYSIINIFLNWL